MAFLNSKRDETALVNPAWFSSETIQLIGKSTGDAESAEEDDLVQTMDLQSSVLKVGHHGGNDSTFNELLDAVKPEYAVISCGEYNPYGHPTDGVLNRLKDHNVQVFRTDIIEPDHTKKVLGDTSPIKWKKTR